MKMSPPYIPLKNFLERLESSLLHRSKNIIKKQTHRTFHRLPNYEAKQINNTNQYSSRSYKADTVNNR